MRGGKIMIVGTVPGDSAINFLKINREVTIQTVFGNDSNLLIVFYVQIMPDDLVMQLHRF